MKFQRMFRGLAIAAGLFVGTVAFAADGVIPTTLEAFERRDPEAFRMIDEKVGDAQLIGLSESVHGSSAYLRIQVALVKHWVEKRGVRAIFIEGGVWQLAPLTEYIATCRGNLDTAIKRLYNPTPEFRDLAIWLCRYNRAHPRDRVLFHGVDIWERTWEHRNYIARTVEEYFPGEIPAPLKGALKTASKHCWGQQFNDWSMMPELMKILTKEKKIPDVDYQPCITAMDTIARFIHDEKVGLLDLFGPWGYADLQIAHATLLGWMKNFDVWAQRFDVRWEPRDRAMADNLISLWRAFGLRKRAVFIGHTSHISRSASAADWWKTGSVVLPSAGHVLASRLGNAYKAVGLTGYDIDGSQGDFLTPTAEASLDRALHAAGVPMAVIDPRGRFIRSRPRWWLQNENQAEAFRDGIFLVPSDHYDVLIFVDRSLPAKEFPRDRDVFEPLNQF